MTENIFQKRNSVFKTGLVFTVFWSAIIGFFNIAVLFLFGIPILGLLIGFILIWLADENIKTKILTTFTSIPIILFFFFLFYLLLPKAEPEVFLIPQNFRGEIHIFLEESCGQKPTYKNGKRVYEIPESGVLITNLTDNYGVQDQEFYLVDENGKQKELPLFSWHKLEDEKQSWRYIFSNTELSPDSVGVFYYFGQPVNTINYIVADFQYFEVDSNTASERRRQLWEKAELLLKKCRQNQ
jgi:hypothetical protein